MPSAMEYLYLPAPHEGLDLSLAPHQLPRTRAWYMHNFMPFQDGRVMLRGPISRIVNGDLTITEGTKPYAVFPNINGSVITTVDPTTTVLARAPWRAFLDIVGTPSPPVQGSTIYTIWSSGVMGTSGAIPFIGPVWAEHRGLVWGPSLSGPPATITHNNHIHDLTLLAWYTPALSGAGASGSVAFSPQASQGIASYGGRLFVLGGTAPGTATPIKQNSLWYTNIDADPAAAVTSWQTNGVNNQIVVGPDIVSDWGLALVPLSRQLVIFKRNSIWRLFGLSEDTWTLQNVTNRMGILEPRAWACVDDVVWWISHEGLMRYDGTDITNETGGARLALLPAIVEQWAPQLGIPPLTAYAAVRSIGNGRLFITVGEEQWGSTGSDEVNFQGIFDTTQKRWCTFSTNALRAATTAILAITERQQGRGQFQLYAPSANGKVSTYDLTYLADPLSTPAGYYGHDRGLNSAKFGFAAQLKLPPLRASSPRARALIHRLGAEYAYQKVSDTSQNGAFTVSLQRYLMQGGQDLSAADQVGSNLALPARATGTTIRSARPQLAWGDMGGTEATDVYVQIDREGTALDDVVTAADIFGTALEYSTPTHRRSS